MNAPYRIQITKHLIDHPMIYSISSNETKRGWDYTVSTANYRIAEVYKNWCKENVGPNRWNFYGEWKKIPFEFKFIEEQDLLAFKLKFNL
jgi:hypothetical protein